MTVGLSTAHLMVPQTTVAGVLDALAAAAPAAVELAAGGPEPLARALLGELGRRRTGVPIVAVEAFCPGPRPLAAPALAALDANERAAARQLGERTIYAAAELGAKLVVVALGTVEGAAAWPAIMRAFERGELDEEAWRPRRAARDAAAARHLDAARLTLEPLLRLAEVAEVTLALCNRARYDQLPDPTELDALLRDFRGAPLGACYDTAAAYVQETLGSAAPGAHLAAFGRRALAVHLTDAAGTARGLCPGVGEVDFAALREALPADAPRFVHCAPGVYAREVAEALAAMRAALG